MILCDCHMHSSHSGDSNEGMENMIAAAIDKGLDHITFTEHCDFCFPGELGANKTFEVDVQAYTNELMNLKDRYRDKILVGYGIELGLQSCAIGNNRDLLKKHKFDFVIGSIHVIEGMDPYYPEFFDSQSEEEAFHRYFQCMLDNIEDFWDFDVLGHMDYIVRYAPGKESNYRVSSYVDIIDAILSLLIQRGKGLEINTAGLRAGLSFCHPHQEILKRYRELGGEIVTIGSDAHDRSCVGQAVDRAEQLLVASGFKYYCIFRERKPDFVVI